MAEVEGLNEESDQLTGIGPIKHSIRSAVQPRQQRRWRMLKIILVVLLVCFILLSLATTVRYYTLRECENNLETAVQDTITADNRIQQTNLSLHKKDQNIPDNDPLILTLPISSPPPQQAHQKPPLQKKQKEEQVIFHNQPIKNQNLNIKPQPQYRSDNNSFNLWLLPLQEKIDLLSKVRHDQDREDSASTPFLKSKDEEIDAFFAEFQNRSEVLDWAGVEIDPQAAQRIVDIIKAQLEERNKNLTTLISKYSNKYSGKSGYMPNQNKGITYQQFLHTLELKRLTGNQIFPSDDADIVQLQAQQRLNYQQKYEIDQYAQLPMCIVMPTYNNKQSLRYIWSIESLLQQEYSNYRVIIIDDNSKDKTAEATGVYLKWRGADPSKFVLVKATQHRAALENIYYGVHKYCDYNQIFMIFDGDDELIGRQALKVVNAQYQKEKYYVLYSQFISYNPLVKKQMLEVGISEDYPEFIKRQSSYRTFKHSYSQLRSMISDLILLQPASALKLRDGKFFQLLYDNALFYPAFEMSCRNFAYLPEIFYWYNINTGSNDWKMAKTAFYKENRFGIELQRPFRCIEQKLKQAKESK